MHNGNLNSKVVFIAEAPGRLGAECTGIPLYGDKTGDNFELLLGNIGWKRENIFITNAILCNPQDENGNNSTPTKEEVQNCSYYLEMVLELVNPDVIVTLGVKALDALNHIKKHDFILRDCVAQKLSWNNRHVYPLYHMGPRALIHRGITKQRADFIALSHIVDPMKGLKESKNAKLNTKIDKSANTLLDMVVEIVNELITVSYFKLTKLLYLIDYNHYKEFGSSISGGIYLRMQEGPWIPTLKNISKQYNKELFNVTYIKRKPILSHIVNEYITGLSSEQIIYIHKIVQKYANSTDSSMKVAAYLTEPMKYILEQERKGRNMTKTPVLYKNTSILDVEQESK